MKYRAALFDFDGTLSPSLPLWVKAYRSALLRFGVAVDDDEVRRRCLFKDFSVVATHYGVFSARELEEGLDSALPVVFADAELFPLARSVVEHCRDHGVQTALVTSSPRNIVMSVVERFKLGELFEFVICGDDVDNYKPHPEPLFTTLAALNRLPAEAVMIGDSWVDVLAGKAAGTRTALYMPAAPDPFHDAERLRATAPDYIFEDHSEVPGVLGLPGFSS